MKLVATGNRWEAEVEPFGGMYRYRYRAKGRNTVWHEAFAGEEPTAIAEVAAKMGEANLLDFEEMITWSQAD